MLRADMVVQNLEHVKGCFKLPILLVLNHLHADRKSITAAKPDGPFIYGRKK